MPDLSGFPAVDVAIGLSFVYFLLSLVTSALTETVSAVFQLRFRTLQRGIRELIVDGDVDEKALAALNTALAAIPDGYDAAFALANDAGLLTDEDKKELEAVVARDRTQSHNKSEAALKAVLEGHALSVWDRFENSPRLRALFKQTGFVSKIPVIGKRGPSYVPPRVFALSLLDTLAPPEDGEHGHDVVKQAQHAAATVHNPLLQKWLQDALVEGEQKRDQVLASLEASFDGVMNRVSGWYKRYATIWVIVFSVLVAGAMNADSYAIGTHLWKDQAVRNAIVSQAGSLTDTTCPTGATPEGAAAGAKLTLDQAAKCVTDLQQLGLPIGWGDDNRPQWSATGVGGKLLGLIITVFALMLGAPFWFDTLSKLARLRTTGKPEPTGKT